MLCGDPGTGLFICSNGTRWGLPEGFLPLLGAGSRVAASFRVLRLGARVPGGPHASASSEKAMLSVLKRPALRGRRHLVQAIPAGATGRLQMRPDGQSHRIRLLATRTDLY
jgi:hypothetical protein